MNQPLIQMTIEGDLCRATVTGTRDEVDQFKPEWAITAEAEEVTYRTNPWWVWWFGGSRYRETVTRRYFGKVNP